ncbi:hypothetical protein TNIN_291901 [Trichonephila inaurata madagascariensis]|uniref:Uncharacterized protein n=1 Tax=Trichonephila inaurata madagascariensis TaxID=2747483 RepID=A0A8X6XLB7_9ARAC|nr:hypothetical protein TNIN_291901 [Trichonephila inaurata madagascariensis]
MKKKRKEHCRNEDVSGRTTALDGSTRPPVLRRRRGGHRSSVRLMTSLAPLAHSNNNRPHQPLYVPQGQGSPDDPSVPTTRR